MKKIIIQIIAGTLGIWLATIFVSGAEVKIIPGYSSLFGINFTQSWQIFILIGISIGLINSFIKPVLKFIAIPVRILTLGIATLLIDMFLIWIVDILFPELVIQGLIALFWTTIIVCLCGFLCSKFYHK